MGRVKQILTTWRTRSVNKEVRMRIVEDIDGVRKGTTRQRRMKNEDECASG